jgi:hypothetical protein
MVELGYLIAQVVVSQPFLLLILLSKIKSMFFEML